MDVVLALGFDLFFKPKLMQAAEAAGITLRHAQPADAARLAADATRVIADASSPGVADALTAIRAARPDIPILACYPHVEVARADHIRNLGGTPVTRGHFNAHVPDALTGKLA